MLLNKFRQEHQKAKQLKSTLAVANRRVKEQEEQIQKVSARLDVRRSAAQIAESEANYQKNLRGIYEAPRAHRRFGDPTENPQRTGRDTISLAKFSPIFVVNRPRSKSASISPSESPRLGSARVSRAGFGVAPKLAFLKRHFGSRRAIERNFAIARTRSPARETRPLT